MYPDKFGMSGKPSPKICPDCEGKLGPLKYGREYDKNYKVISPPTVNSDDFYRACSCGCVVQWAYPNVWKRRHILPIMDDKLVIAKGY